MIATRTLLKGRWPRRARLILIHHQFASCLGLLRGVLYIWVSGLCHWRMPFVVLEIRVWRANRDVGQANAVLFLSIEFITIATSYNMY